MELGLKLTRLCDSVQSKSGCIPEAVSALMTGKDYRSKLNFLARFLSF